MSNSMVIEDAHGTQRWYSNGLLHRTDGPAVEFYNGTKHWYKEGKLHRTDGPAIEARSGDRYWYLEGEEATREEVNKIAGISEKYENHDCGGSVETATSLIIQADGTKVWYIGDRNVPRNEVVEYITKNSK